MKDYYYILGVTSNASTGEVKRAYRKLSTKFHPDKNDGDKFFEDRFKEINEAYEVLGNSARRVSYDAAFVDEVAPASRPYTSRTSPRSEPISIVFFTTDKLTVSIGDIVTFSWEVKNATSVELKPFGKVPLIGQKSIKVLGFNQPTGLLALLEAKNEFDDLVKAQLIMSRHVKQTPNGEGVMLGPSDSELTILTWSAFGIITIVVISLFIFKPDIIAFKKNQPVEVTTDTVSRTNKAISESDNMYGDRSNKSKRKKFIPPQVEAYSANIHDVEHTETEELPKSKSANDAESAKDDEVYTVVEQNPEPIGGIAALSSYLNKNLRYPAPAQRANVSGKVYVSFVVDVDGSIQNVTVLKGLGFGTDEEAARVVQEMPKMEAG